MASNKVNLDVSEKLDITCRKGDSFELTLNFKDSSGTGLLLATDNYEFLMQVRGLRQSSGSRPLVMSTLGKGEQKSDGGAFFTFENADDSGNVTLKATADIMKDISAGRYTYDLQYKVDGVVTTVLKGRFIVNQDISEEIG
jgi:hypothetical protein